MAAIWQTKETARIAAYDSENLLRMMGAERISDRATANDS
jgi:hypothetical protein